MALDLAISWGIQRPPLVDASEMTRFHSDDYVHFLKTVTPDNMQSHLTDLQRFSVGEDCPVFDGMFEFNQLATSGSLGGAAMLNAGRADIAINWAGGFHHAKKSEASGFCYVNDIVLSILELLKVHQRVLYIDIDIHHGDGVEEAFYTTDRVMTVSFHKYGDFFPGTGDWKDCGHGKGKRTALNFPLKDGMDDDSYRMAFRPLIRAVMDKYRPGAVVLQCGADSLAGDRLGCFNLSTSGHADCVEFVKSFGLPTLVLGGGGYTMRNVARCWTMETAVCLGKTLDDDLPYNDYFEYFAPSYKLHVDTTTMENRNTRSYLESVEAKLMEYLRDLEPAPGVAIETGSASHTATPTLRSAPTGPEGDADTTGDKARGGRREAAGEWYDAAGRVGEAKMEEED